MTDSFYTELHEELRLLCDPQTGEFGPGDRFLTERQVAERFGTTRPTANKALASLVGQGVLEFRRGVGTFVREGPPVVDLRPAASLTEQVTAAGAELQTKVLSFRQTRASRTPEAVRRALSVASHERLISLDRLRIVDSQPFSLERLFLVGSYCEDLSRADAKGSLFALWEGYYDLVVAGIDQVISARNIEVDEADVLQLKRGSAALSIVNTGFLKNGSRLWHGETLISAERYELVGRLAGPSVARPAVGRFRYEEDDDG